MACETDRGAPPHRPGGGGSKTHVSNKFPSDTDAAGPQDRGSNGSFKTNQNNKKKAHVA